LSNAAVLSGRMNLAPAILFLEPEEQFEARVARQEQRYWRDVASQRGGKEVIFVWKASVSANGYVVMGATPLGI